MVPGSIPGAPGSFVGHLLVMSGQLFDELWDLLERAWERFGILFEHYVNFTKIKCIKTSFSDSKIIFVKKPTITI